MKMMNHLALIGSFVWGGTWAHAAILSGDVLVFDIGIDTNETLGVNWNNVSEVASAAAPTISDAIRFSDGAATGVGFRILAQEGGRAGIGGATVGAPATTSNLAFSGSGLIPGSAIEDLGYMSNEVLGSSADSTNGFTFSGLDNSLTYTVSWITSINAARDTLDWTVGANTVAIDPEDNTTVYSFSGISTDGFGNLTVSIDIDQVTNGETAHINAVEIVAVPEPSMFMLVGMTFCGLLFFRRKG